jgi:hypothetical protein
MIVPSVDPHVKLPGHVTIAAKVSISRSQFLTQFIDETGAGFSLRFVQVMIEGVVFIGTVTLGT